MTMDVERCNFEMSIPVTRERVCALSLFLFCVSLSLSRTLCLFLLPACPTFSILPRFFHHPGTLASFFDLDSSLRRDVCAVWRRCNSLTAGYARSARCVTGDTSLNISTTIPAQ